MALSLTPDIEALLRLGLAVLCGLVVGLNRAHHGATPHPNRLRVHVLVGLSAALMVMATGADPQARSRAIQGVATGVGFLGAGEILTPRPSRHQGATEVRGLSSAASIWFTAALGVTVAASSPVLALLALVLANSKDLHTDLGPMELGGLITSMGGTTLKAQRLDGRPFDQGGISYWDADWASADEPRGHEAGEPASSARSEKGGGERPYRFLF